MTKTTIDISRMNKVLIVNTRSSDRKLAGMVMWGAWAVASYLKKNLSGGDVVFLDENNEDDFENKFKEAARGRDTIGFSITSMQIKYTMPLVRYLRTNYPNIKIILGGIHPILFPDQDYGNYFDQVISAELPKDYFDYGLLSEKVKEVFRRKRGQVITGFNCSYKCTFCVNSVRNCHYESVSAEKVLENIDYIVREFNPPKIYFRDEDFFQDIEKARKIVDGIIERGYRFRWEVSSRVNHFVIPGRVDDGFLEKIKKSGCLQFRFGVESGSNRILNFLRKGQNVDFIKRAVSQCVKYDIHACCSFMTGIPTETAEDREETFRLIEELAAMGKKVEILGPQMYRPYPGGELYEKAKSYGLKFPEKIDEWETFYDKNPLGDVFDRVVYYPWLSRRESETLLNVWVVAHYGINYYRSEKIIKRIIGFWFFNVHWKRRWFSGCDINLFMYLRRKLLKTDLD